MIKWQLKATRLIQLASVQVIEQLFNLYGNNPDNMDLWPAGLLETALNPGPLFRSVLIDQFSRIRSADRFWYKNYDNG